MCKKKLKKILVKKRNIIKASILKKEHTQTMAMVMTKVEEAEAEAKAKAEAKLLDEFSCANSLTNMKDLHGNLCTTIITTRFYDAKCYMLQHVSKNGYFSKEVLNSDEYKLFLLNVKKLTKHDIYVNVCAIGLEPIKYKAPKNIILSEEQGMKMMFHGDTGVDETQQNKICHELQIKAIPMNNGLYYTKIIVYNKGTQKQIIYYMELRTLLKNKFTEHNTTYEYYNVKFKLYNTGSSSS